MTLAVAHGERRGDLIVGVLDAVRERRPPFSPDSVTEEFLDFLKGYHVTTVTGDRWGAQFVQERYRKAGVKYNVSEKVKSDIYVELLPAINSRRVDLLDLPRLTTQLCSLERRTARGGRDSIDHPTGNGQNCHDDVANAVAGALTLALVDKKKVTITPEHIAAARKQGRYRGFGGYRSAPTKVFDHDARRQGDGVGSPANDQLLQCRHAAEDAVQIRKALLRLIDCMGQDRQAGLFAWCQHVAKVDERRDIGGQHGDGAGLAASAANASPELFDAP